jgi:hypothetical protein
MLRTRGPDLVRDVLDGAIARLRGSSGEQGVEGTVDDVPEDSVDAEADQPLRGDGTDASADEGRNGPVAEELPIEDYDSLSAVQVVPRLTGLSEDELTMIEAYETAGRGRRTILGKIDQVRSRLGS